MIFNSSSETNPWKRCAPVFFMFNTFSLMNIWVVLEINEISKFLVNYLLLITPVLGVILFLLGIFFKETKRLKNFVLIIGLFGVLPIFTTTLIPFFFSIFISKYDFLFKFYISFSYAIFLIFIFIFNIIKMKRVEKYSIYIKDKIKIKDSFFYINLDEIKNYNIYSKIKENSSTKTNFKKIFPFLFLVYPIQRLLTNVSGNVVVMYFLAILTIPLSIYMTIRMAEGYYLWIYLISHYEKYFDTHIGLMGQSEKK
ncbi:hypothetical protein SAMN05192549_103470 [Duganella sacchari]|uniref:Uncharacterized protein n=1 Tax=Duganella sacchari TaxID=551987 RepID=A0A1M7N5Y7_9BURK|nr:hypothetical protein [Duganella sacchari]SHM98454.1 hypothetical protein SAMN05192549_103470 [Duganella sacchari]